jgi:thiamine-phosphate pyrophosphorylase
MLINDDWRLALEIKADGIHLGQHDEDPVLVRASVGDEMLIGVSCYASLTRAQTLLRCAPAYIAFGAMFVSSTKPLAPPAPLSVLGEAQRLTISSSGHCPGIAAIGGINLSNAPAVIKAGATSLAVVGSLFQATDITGTARAFSELFN